MANVDSIIYLKPDDPRINDLTDEWKEISPGHMAKKTITETLAGHTVVVPHMADAVGPDSADVDGEAPAEEAAPAEEEAPAEGKRNKKNKKRFVKK